MAFNFKKIDHIQLAAPKGCEEVARNFFTGILELTEIKKPSELQKRGGVWFGFGDYQIHVGVEEPFTPAKKAHPAFIVENIEELKIHLASRGVAYTKDNLLPGANRIHLHDPFGNRIELLEWIGQ